MKPIQQDDIQDYLNSKSKNKFWFIHVPTKKMVRAETKSNANTLFRKQHGIQTQKKDVRQANGRETESLR